ncbi:hypothetical protein [Planomicrobium sp. Y74]|uniref:hypothetical protein n=1 Tax=Planomicrobium sp. Y74 TaxID=2478977 RepID=UPI000EF497FB|nr:hypothetical protein [Planomicrobium sp. Y74]RLQ92229.1 hypothetical protein D9754_05455 [Planomicrobium sp. Y74]
MRRKFVVFLAIATLTGCSSPSETSKGQSPSLPSQTTQSPQQNSECPDGIIDWIDALKINDIQYYALPYGTYTVEENMKGEVIGEVLFEMDNKACSDHQMQNGDAAYLEVGTEIFEFEGYNPDFRVIANDVIYEVKENEKAETIGDLYDIEGKVVGMSLRSYFDGSFITDLKEEHWTEFLDEYLALEYVGFDKIYEKIGNEDSTFLDIHLEDGTTVRFSYWTEANAVNPGAFASERMLEIISLYK